MITTIVVGTLLLTAYALAYPLRPEATSFDYLVAALNYATVPLWLTLPPTLLAWAAGFIHRVTPVLIIPWAALCLALAIGLVPVH